MPCSQVEIVYRSASQHALLQQLAKVAGTNAEVLITGPSGVGKELYAAYTHKCSRRCDRPFLTINCSNLSSHLLENEMFGHARGAYTGADAAVGGIVAAAEGGSLFLDEIDTLPIASQAKLLRFIQSREYRRLGDTTLRRADVRVIAASNANLDQLVQDGLFRNDLYFRLRVIPIEVAPLCERLEDIAPLIEHFAARYAKEYDLPEIRFNSAAMRRIKGHSWPGNVRELENHVRYLTCLQLGRPVEPGDLALNRIEPKHARVAPVAAQDDGPDMVEDRIRPLGRPQTQGHLDGYGILPTPKSLQEAKHKLVVNFERDYIERALANAGGNINKAAQASGKNRRAFFELMRKHGLVAVEYRTN